MGSPAWALLYSRRVSPNLRIGIALLLASVAFQASFITLDAFVSDEGIVLVAADDVANGRLLYRDTNIPLTPTVYCRDWRSNSSAATFSSRARSSVR